MNQKNRNPKKIHKRGVHIEERGVLRVAISRWRAPRESEREATRHKLEVGSSIPGHLGVRAVFLQRVARRSDPA